MGISGLLPLLKPLHKPVHLDQLSGLCVGIDAYVWLHRGSHGCAMDLALGTPTTKHIDYCMKRLEKLRESGIRPLVVFDGGYLPMKAHTESDRRARRLLMKAKAKDFLAAGNKTKAFECFQSCVDVSPEMAWEWIKILKQQDVDYIVAPYEADAQLAYLCKAGTISAVITEDSDLLTYGCPRVIFKLDKDGNGVEINQSDFGMIKEMRFWDIDRFRQMCILSGCDYLDSPRGIGLKKALKLLHRTDAYKLIDMWKNWGQSVKAPVLPADYSSKFKVADLVFLYQRVYCPKKKGMVTLNTLDIPLDEELSNAIGPYFSFNTSLLDDDIAHRIAIGEIHPMTKAAFTNQDACSIIAAGRLSLPPSNKPKRFIKLADDECEIALSCNHVENKENIPPGSECIVSEAAKSIPDKPKVQTSTLFSISLKEKVLTPVNSDIEKHTSSIPLKRASPFSFPQLLKKPGSHIPRGIGFSISKTSIPTKSPYFTAVSESKPAAFKTNAETTAPIVPKRKTLGLRSINI